MRLPATLLAGLLLAAPTVVAETGGKNELAGNWTVDFFPPGNQVTLWLVRFAEKDGKLTGTVVSADNVPASTLEGLRVKGGLVDFTIKVQGQAFSFQGKVPKGKAEKIVGLMARGATLWPAQLERTSAEDLKGKPQSKLLKLPAELNTKALAELRDSPQLFDAAQKMFGQAVAKKVEPAQVREWSELVTKAAATYGPRWQRDVELRIAETLGRSKEYAAVAAEAARRAMEGAGKKAPAEDQLRAMSALAAALKHEGNEEYRKVAARVDELENEAYHEHNKHALPFTPQKYAGRKDKSERAVLVELFTGAQCPPCVAADLAFDGLAKTYSPKDVILLQYHEHIPGPDPLTNADSEARMKYYSKDVRGTPTIFFNGKSEAGGGGPEAVAKAKYEQYVKVIDPLLEKQPTMKLQAKAVRKGDKVLVTATAASMGKPGEKLRLRLVLVQEWARYRGGNGLAYHHHVVRDMPGGPEGLALTDEKTQHEVTVELPKVGNKLTGYLEDFTKKRGPFTGGSWPLRLRDLRIVAFVQDDDTKEVLQAVEVPIPGDRD